MNVTPDLSRVSIRTGQLIKFAGLEGLFAPALRFLSLAVEQLSAFLAQQKLYSERKIARDIFIQKFNKDRRLYDS
jgi:hypothetical protein